MSENVLFEIGLEEMPARFIHQAEEQLSAKTKQWLADLRIPHGEIVTFSTPRRLAVKIRDLAQYQNNIDEEAKGPALHIAKDDAGNWTKAAIGFTKGQGKTVEDIYVKEIKGVPYIFVNKQVAGKSSVDLLSGFEAVILSLQFGKNMHWGEEHLRYVRPIRWLVALYGQQVIPFEIAHVHTSNVTYGHRFLGKKITIDNPLDYETLLREQFVIADAKEREQMIISGIREIEREEALSVPIDQSLLQEVRDLVEYPTVFRGSFAKDFLEVPTEVLITSMKEHQRYFPVFDAKGQLLPCFVGVRNGDDKHLETVVRGNEKVLRARLADAKFFYDSDRNHSIAFYQQKLSNVVFQEKLGTYQDKVDRVVQITASICNKLQYDENITQKAIRAAEICKFDLGTNMVNEFTDLQGIMGEKYARHFGEDEAVCLAIGEQYLPDHAQGELPKTIIGSVLSVADKLDSIAGGIYVGLRPTGSQDPYALRRQALGMLRILKEQDWTISVEDLLTKCSEIFVSSQVQGMETEKFKKELHDFIVQRVIFLLKEAGNESDIIEAVTKYDIGVLPYTFAKASILSEKRNDDAFKTTQEALSRVLNLAAKGNPGTVDKDLFETQSEQKLFDTFQSKQEGFESANHSHDAVGAMAVLDDLALPIHDFFDNNMVMAKNGSVKENRLTLLANLADMIDRFADFRAIAWKQHQ